MRYTPSGVPVASFNLAINKSWTTPDGEKQDRTTWFRVTAWRKTAEIVSQHLAKGRQVMVVGEVEARGFTDKAGEVRASLEVTAQIVKFLGSRADGPGPAVHGGQSDESPSDYGEEDIPF